MTDLREDMTKAIQDQTWQLAKIRRCNLRDAAVTVSASFAENLRNSRETSMESYWKAMLAIADDLVVKELGER